MNLGKMEVAAGPAPTISLSLTAHPLTDVRPIETQIFPDTQARHLWLAVFSTATAFLVNPASLYLQPLSQLIRRQNIFRFHRYNFARSLVGNFRLSFHREKLSQVLMAPPPAHQSN